jgi:AraC-like DNA-binding protein
LQELADVAELNRYHFARAFKQSFGIPPYRYYVSRRMERAKALLEVPSRSVAEVGLMLGFVAETSSFTTSFHRSVGITPSDYHPNDQHKALRNGIDIGHASPYGPPPQLHARFAWWPAVALQCPEQLGRRDSIDCHCQSELESETPDSSRHRSREPSYGLGPGAGLCKRRSSSRRSWSCFIGLLAQALAYPPCG